MTIPSTSSADAAGPAAPPAKKASRTRGLLAVLMCVHCSATFFVVVAALALGGLSVPFVFGIRADFILVPLVGASAFTGWLWWGKRAVEREAACRVP